jgi:predicted DNA-binding transcriptional regulator AlpA
MSATPLHDPYVTCREGAELFGISASTFWRRVQDKSFPPGVKIGGCRRWRLSQLEAVRQRLDEKGI